MIKRALLSWSLHVLLLKVMDWLLSGILLSWIPTAAVSAILMIWTICYPGIYKRFHIPINEASVFLGSLFVHGLVFILSYRFMPGFYMNNLVSIAAIAVLFSVVECIVWKTEADR